MPIPASVESERGRLLVALVVAGGAVLEADVGSYTTSDPAALARVLGDAVARAARQVGKWPPTLVLRHPEFSDTLVPELAERGTEVIVAPHFAALDRVARALTERFVEDAPWPPFGHAERWADWGLAPALVADFFRAYARVHRGAPWHHLPEWRPLFVEDGEEEMVVSVVGGGGLEMGLVVYTLEGDFGRMLDGDDFTEALESLEGPVLFVNAGSREELSPPMRKEILRSGWEVAAPEAYPRLLPFRTPGGGVSEPMIRRLTRVCDALADLLEQHGNAVGAPDPIEFRTRGMTLLLAPILGESGNGALDALVQELQSMDGESGEDPMERIRAWVEERNDSPLDELSGLTPNQAQRLLAAGFGEASPLQVVTDLRPDELEGARFVQNSRIFLAALRETGGTARTSAGNLNRAFVRRMVEEMRIEDEGVRELLLARTIREENFGELHVSRVVLGLAGLWRSRKGQFIPTKAGLDLAEPERIAHLAARIFRTFFGEFNLAYLDGAPDNPGLQHVLPLALWRIGVQARDWIDEQAFVDRVLPRVLDRDLDAAPHSRLALIPIQTRVIEPLVGFGLLESRRRGPEGTPRWKWSTEVRVTPLYHRMLRFEW